MACVTRAREGDPVEEGLRKVPDPQKDDLAQRRIQGRPAPLWEPLSFVTRAGITDADMETWERLKVSGKTRCVTCPPNSPRQRYYLILKEPNA